MHFHVRQPWQLPERMLTSESVYCRRRLERREFLGWLGLAAAASTAGCQQASDEEIQQAGAVPLPASVTAAKSQGPYPARRNSQYEYGRPETAAAEAARYTNFYEFSSGKDSWRYVKDFRTDGWTVEVGGLCAAPRTFDLDDLYRDFSLEERHYRFRCVETWAMCVPWTGFPLAALLKKVEPSPAAKYVVFETFNRPEQAPHLRDSPEFPWPYTEGLSLAEAGHELSFLATGIYGRPLPKQHGAPLRLVLPWKYGFKSIKSLVRITLADRPPATFWNTLAPHEYGFEANVDPGVPHPRWSQRTEWMLGTREEYPTKLYNGYADLVGGLYRT